MHRFESKETAAAETTVPLGERSLAASGAMAAGS